MLKPHTRLGRRARTRPFANDPDLPALNGHADRTCTQLSVTYAVIDDATAPNRAKHYLDATDCEPPALITPDLGQQMIF